MRLSRFIVLQGKSASVLAQAYTLDPETFDQTLQDAATTDIESFRGEVSELRELAASNREGRLKRDCDAVIELCDDELADR